MTACLNCGTATVPGEAFCSNCGTKNPAASNPAASAEDTTLEMEEAEGAAAAATAVAPVSTDEVAVNPDEGASESGSIESDSDEISSDSFGGGMGAVYLAKDRNLGDAPRAVKEMVEAHLDPAQHEKAIGDFKRESLLLTSLEHPSIPTIYDYFYDEPLSRFYLVMKLSPVAIWLRACAPRPAAASTSGQSPTGACRLPSCSSIFTAGPNQSSIAI